MTTDNPDPDLARRILLDAGAPDDDRTVAHEIAPGWWQVAAPGIGSGCSDPTRYTLDTPQEVAAYLVAQMRAVSEVVNEVLAESVRQESGRAHEPAPHPVDSGDSGAAPGDDGSAEDGATGGGDEVHVGHGSDGPGDRDIFDAEYADIPEDADRLGLPAPDDVLLEGGDIDPLLLEAAEEAPDLGAEILEDAPDFSDQARFYGLDDLDRRRSLRIGDVCRYALMLKSPWTAADDARLVELRNFAMGVAEGRWPNDATLEGELTQLEAVLGRNNAIDAVQRAKVEALNGATREEVEAFVVEDGWP